jgi:transposase
VLVELGVVEQRHKAVLEVLDGAKVTDVALLYGVSRKTVHKWLRRYAAEGFRGLADKSSKCCGGTPPGRRDDRARLSLSPRHHRVGQPP